MLNPVTTDIWDAESDLIMSGCHFRIRMTVIRLTDGSLILHSPIHIDDALAAELAALGPVRHIIAPNCLHHVHVSSAQARFPDAALYVAHGLPDKRPDLKSATVLTDDAPPGWAGQLDQIVVTGCPRMNETVFLHRKSKTLIVTDLMFNIHYEPKTWLTPWIFRMAGVWQRPMQSRLWRFLTRDKAGAAASVGRILAWDFDRVVLAHGTNITTDAHSTAQAALWWMLSHRALAA